MEVTPASTLAIQKMEPVHFDSIMKIEETSTENFWNRTTFENHLKERHCKGLVALTGTEIVGYMTYELDPVNGTIQIWNLVVATDRQRQGVGEALVAELKDLVGCEFDSILFNVRESNLVAHVFLRSLGFYCGTISLGYFIDVRMNERVEEDAYCFDYTPNTKGRNKDVPIRITTRLGDVIARPVAGSRGSGQGSCHDQPEWSRSRQG